VEGGTGSRTGGFAWGTRVVDDRATSADIGSPGLTVVVACVPTTNLDFITAAMPNGTVSASADLASSAADVYAIIADYRVHHPQIVPPRYFKKIEVLEGGVGAGTRTRITMRLLGSTHRFEHVVREPEPGRVLEEGEPDGSLVTRFTVEPDAGASRCRVTIETRFAAPWGPLGALKRATYRRLLHPIYVEELQRLSVYAARLA
jgi:Polyketide cyclase / dehydrase and lipid transport